MFKNNPFYKLLSFNSFSIVLKIIMGLVSTKLASIYLGLQGINTLEFFRNFTSISDSLSQFGLQNGVVKNVALSENNTQEKKIVSTAFFLLICTTLAIICVALLFLSKIQAYLFQTTVYEKVLLFYLFSLPIVSLQTILLGYFQGKEEYKKVLFINALGYLLNIAFSFYLIINYQLIGAMYQIVLVPLILTLVTLVFFQKNIKIVNLISLKSVDLKIAKNLLGFTVMSLIGAVLAPISYILIRNLIQENIGIEYAGIWSAVLRLSGFYMMFISSLCNLYFFPRLVKAVVKNEQSNVISEYFKKFIPVVFIGFLFCFLCKNFIIKVVYTDEFLLINKYFTFQLIADFIKSIYLIFGYYLLAKQKIKWYVFFEITSIAVYLLMACFLIKSFNLFGVYYALIASFIVYLCATFVCYKKLP